MSNSPDSGLFDPSTTLSVLDHIDQRAPSARNVHYSARVGNARHGNCRCTFRKHCLSNGVTFKFTFHVGSCFNFKLNFWRLSQIFSLIVIVYSDACCLCSNWTRGSPHTWYAPVHAPFATGDLTFCTVSPLAATNQPRPDQWCKKSDNFHLYLLIVFSGSQVWRQTWQKWW